MVRVLRAMRIVSKSVDAGKVEEIVLSQLQSRFGSWLLRFQCRVVLSVQVARSWGLSAGGQACDVLTFKAAPYRGLGPAHTWDVGPAHLLDNEE